MQGRFAIGPAVAAVVIGLATSEASIAAPRPIPECRTAPARIDEFKALGPRGELIFGSGARAVLSGLRWPEDVGQANAAEQWLLTYRGRAMILTARGEPDRWGRIRVDALVEGEATDLAASLIGAGLAAVDAGEGDVLCRPALLALEAPARTAKRGVWQESPPEVGDGVALRARAGRFVVVQGRLVGVGERPARTYLDFVARGRDGLTVTVSKRTWRQLQERGLSAAALRGRLVRVRGVVEIGRGPILDIASADMVEVLDEERAPRR